MTGLTYFPKELSSLKKTLINFILFLSTIGGVVVTLALDRKLTIPEFFGLLIVVSSVFVILYLFLFFFRREVLSVNRKVFFILLAIIAFLVSTRVVTVLSSGDLLYLIPFAIIPVTIRTFYDARLALFILLVTIILTGFLLPDPFEFIFISFSTGMAAIFALNNNYRKIRLLLTVLIVIASYAVLWTGLTLIREGSLSSAYLRTLLLFTGNGFLVLISYPLIFLFEQNFLLLSDATMLELSDTNQPILRKLATDAPGSFQHSLQVSNLAEEAARVIGANVLLVRTGSLYHDIGKIANPEYFVENQTDGNSPHDKMDPKESARIIINHVRNGVNLAKNYKLPVQIIDFIRMHHGTTVAYYFFKKYIDLHPGESHPEKYFTYPGPKPISKETAVVMMADAVEAASRSLSEYNEETISELVERIIYLQEQDGQFTEVPLTYKDMSEIKDAFKRRLGNIFHARIIYPDRL
ncbi:MAG: HDIG domain-containing protein [Bacteroidales bacterium]|nr:HDIG domain-containing protein [Bacteroidales bacterium]MBN2632309.1 HDIG domain-containing protein [Bacteroidales bacterium]